MYDIQDDDLPAAVKAVLKKRGWRFDANVQAWRQYNDAGEHFSPVPGDHQRQWDIDTAAAVAEIEAETAQVQNNATPGHTGTVNQQQEPYRGASSEQEQQQQQ